MQNSYFQLSFSRVLGDMLVMRWVLEKRGRVNVGKYVQWRWPCLTGWDCRYNFVFGGLYFLAILVSLWHEHYIFLGVIFGVGRETWELFFFPFALLMLSR